MKKLLMAMLIGLCACQPEERLPEGIMDREKFKEMLADAQLIEARINNELVNVQRGQVPVDRYYEEMFRRHGIDKEQFTHTFEYFSSRPEEMKAIYEEVIAELQRRKDLPPVSEQLADPVRPDSSPTSIDLQR